MIDAYLKAQADWWNQFTGQKNKPDLKILTPEDIEANKKRYRELIGPKIKNPESLP